MYEKIKTVCVLCRPKSYRKHIEKNIHALFYTPLLIR